MDEVLLFKHSKVLDVWIFGQVDGRCNKNVFFWSFFFAFFFFFFFFLLNANMNYLFIDFHLTNSSLGAFGWFDNWSDGQNA